MIILAKTVLLPLKLKIATMLLNFKQFIFKYGSPRNFQVPHIFVCWQLTSPTKLLLLSLCPLVSSRQYQGQKSLLHIRPLAFQFARVGALALAWSRFFLSEVRIMLSGAAAGRAFKSLSSGRFAASPRTTRSLSPTSCSPAGAVSRHP